MFSMRLYGLFIYYTERMNAIDYNVCGLRTIQLNDTIISAVNNKTKRKRLLSQEEIELGCKMGIDTHADTSCAGRHVRIMEYVDGKVFNVAPFHSDYQPIKEVRLINGVVAVDLENGSGIILELNNFLDFTESMEDSILVPMQARLNGIIIDDIPASLCPHRRSTQSVYIPELKLRIPILFNGPIPYFKIRYPTDTDMEEYQWVSLTNISDWDPYSTKIDEINNNRSGVEAEDQFFLRAIKSVIIKSVKSESTYWTDLSPIMLAKVWKIPLKVAGEILECTTHNSRRIQDGKMSRRFRTDLFQKRYKRLGGEFSRFYTDTLFFGIKTRRGNTCAQVYANRAGYVRIYNLPSKAHAHESLSNFVHEVGIPSSLHSDGAKELIQGEFMRKMKKYEIYNTVNEPYSPWQNLAERMIGNIKRRTRHFMRDTNTPIRLVDYVMRYVASLISFTPTKLINADNRSPYEIVHGNTPNISEYISFDWYCFVWFWDPVSFQRQRLGRWLGVAHNIGSGHVYYVLNKNGIVEARSTVSKLSCDEMESSDIQEQMRNFNFNIKEKIGDFDESIFADDNIEEIEHESKNIDFTEENISIDYESDDNYVEKDSPNEDLSAEIVDEYIGAKVQFPREGKLFEGTIKSRKRTDGGNQLIGKPNTNPIKDTRVYNVEFHDGSIEEYTTNMIAEAIYNSIDDDGYNYSLLEGIIGHRKNQDAIDIKNGFIINGDSRRRIITTRGWDLLILWQDGSESWMPMHAIKSSNPVDVAEYASANDLGNEPAFAWWIPEILRKRNRIISKLRTNRKVRKNIKFGVEIPVDIEQARHFDRINHNDLWEKALIKEISKVRVAFELLEDHSQPLPGSKHINYHVIFDVKHDLTRKARLVAGGHLNKTVPSYVTYSSVVTKESVRLCFLLAALNDLDVVIGDISNAYLNAKPREKCFVTITDSYLFGPSAIGKKAQIVRALYGMKSSGAAWRELFASVLHNHLKFDNSMADHDVWLKPDVDKEGKKYYSYICIYVDDVLIASKEPHTYMDLVKDQFSVKPESIESPKMYLGMNCKLNPEGNWLLSPDHYVKEFLRVSERLISQIGLNTSGKGTHPFSNISYRPEMDCTMFCNAEQLHVYQQLLGMFRWMVELGRMDILYETTVLASYLTCPRIGHLKQAINMVLYIRKHEKSSIVMDPTYLDINWTGNEDENPESRRKFMKSIYQDAVEDIPENAPEPRGKPIQINVYCDADHASNKVTRRSHTGILIFVNMAPISWFSKRQNTVETSTFGSEFVALRIAVEKIISLRYKLRMMGVPIPESANIFVDNESVVKSSMNPETTLKKKHVSIAYHKARESFAANIITIYFVRSSENLADLFTKSLPVVRRKELFRAGIFY